MAEDEYEIVPTSPIRRLEKKIQKIESTTSASQISKLIEQIVELIKSNQRVIADVVKSDSELRNEISKLPGKIDELLTSMNEFVEMLKAASEETEKEEFKPLAKKIDDLIEQNKKFIETSQATLTSLSTIDQRLKRLFTYTRYPGRGT